MADRKGRGSCSQRTTVTCAVLFRWLKAKFPPAVKGRSVTEIDGIAKFHVNKQVLSYIVSSSSWLLGIVILPVQFKKVKEHSLANWAGYCVDSGKEERSYIDFSGNFQPLKVMWWPLNAWFCKSFGADEFLFKWIVTNSNEIFNVQAFLYKILEHLLKLSYTKCYAISHTTNTLKSNISNV